MKPKINPFWGYLTVGLTVLTLALCILGAKKGTLLVRTDSKPEETVETFFESIVVGKYEQADACLENYAGLGLESRSANLKWNALLTSYDYSLVGEAVRKGDSAQQTVRLRHLDLNALEKALSKPLNPDAEGSEPVYPSLEELLEQPRDFYTTSELQVTLHYTDGQWLIFADDSLLSALAGGK